MKKDLKRPNKIVKKGEWINIQQKLQVIKMYENGDTYAKISRDMGLHELSIRAIVRKKTEIMASLEKNLSDWTSNVIDDMEKLSIKKK